MALGHDGGTAAEPFTPASMARENRISDPDPDPGPGSAPNPNSPLNPKPALSRHENWHRPHPIAIGNNDTAIRAQTHWMTACEIAERR